MSVYSLLEVSIDELQSMPLQKLNEYLLQRGFEFTSEDSVFLLPFLTKVGKNTTMRVLRDSNVVIFMQERTKAD